MDKSVGGPGHSNLEGAAPASGAEDSSLASPPQLRRLVLNYLVHHCYLHTAQAFARDGLDGRGGDGRERRKGDAGFGDSDDEEDEDAGGERDEEMLSVSMIDGADNRGASMSTTGYGVSRTSGTVTNGGAGTLRRQSSAMEVEALALGSASAVAFRAPSAPAKDRDNGMDLDGDEAMGEAAMGSKTTGAQAGNGVGSGAGASNGNGHREKQAIQRGLPAEEVMKLKLRKEIRDHILSGRIRFAVDLLNAHFPTVLNPPGTTEAMGGSSISWGTTAKPLRRNLPSYPTSLEPSHLSLNLQIQAFIESVRSASTPANPSSPTLSTSQTLPPVASLTSAHSSASRSASPAPSSASSTNSTASTSIHALTHALNHAQSLFANVQNLPPHARALYLKELESVSALMAYRDPETSPVRHYLDQARRVALAEQINSAIMFRTGSPSQPLIESAVRQTSFVWQTLNELKVPVSLSHPLLQARSLAEDIIQPSNSALASGAEGGGNGNGKEKKVGEVLPPWTLSDYLSAR